MPSKRKKDPLKTPAVQYAPNATPAPEAAAAATETGMPAPETPVPVHKPANPHFKALRALWIAKSWPLRRRWWMVLCAFGKHEYENTIVLDAQGEPAKDEDGKTVPSDLQRCVRPDCRVYVGVPKLMQFGKYLQTDDFMVLARTDCPYCHGRGYRGRMILDPSTKAKIPCSCLRVQPVFVEHFKQRGTI
jgi:hypothetical protein